jgi:hypothetical protein
MSSFRLRRVERSEAETVVRIVRAMDEAVMGVSDFTLRDLEDEWRRFSPEESAFFVVDSEDPVAYGTVELRDAEGHSDGYVQPAHFGRGAGGFLVDAMEE